METKTKNQNKKPKQDTKKGHLNKKPIKKTKKEANKDIKQRNPNKNTKTGNQKGYQKKHVWYPYTCLPFLGEGRGEGDHGQIPTSSSEKRGWVASSSGKGTGCDHGQIPCSSFGKGVWWWWSWPYTLIPLFRQGRIGDHIHTRSFLLWERDWL